MGNKLKSVLLYFSLGLTGYFFIDHIFRYEKFDLGKSSFTISGKCTAQDWELNSDASKGKAEIEVKDGKIVRVQSFELSIPSNSFNSGNKRMNKHAYNALRADRYPNIIFSLTRVKEMSGEKNKARMMVVGNLTVAGITKPVEIKVMGNIVGKGILIEGKHALKMSDFNIDPPEFVFGGIKTKDEILIGFRVLAEKSGKIS